MVACKKGDVILVSLDPTKGSEIKKTRPCLIVSPDEMNLSRCKTVIVAPMTSVIRDSVPFRVTTKFKNKNGQVVCDQIRTIDRSRIVKRVGKLSPQAAEKVMAVLQEMFR